MSDGKAAIIVGVVNKVILSVRNSHPQKDENTHNEEIY